jgi:hypothetical protein
MEYFVPLAEMKLHCSSIISVCKTSTFQSSNTNTFSVFLHLFTRKSIALGAKFDVWQKLTDLALGTARLF